MLQFQMIVQTVFLFGLAARVASQSPMKMHLHYFSAPNLDLNNEYTDKLRTAVLGFGESFVLDTNIYHLSRDGASCANGATESCDTNCYNNYRYCALKTPSTIDVNDEFENVTGQFYLVEGARRMCIWQRLRMGHSSSSYQYWDYIHQVHDRGCLQKMNHTCIDEVLEEVLGLVPNCYGDYKRFGVDRKNKVKWMEEGTAAAEEFDVTLNLVPKLLVANQSIPLDVFINGADKDLVQYMCNFWASAEGGGIQPSGCTECMSCDHTTDHFIQCLRTGGTCLDATADVPELTSIPTSSPYPSTTPPTATPVAPVAPVPVPTDVPTVATIIDDAPPSSGGTTTVEPTISSPVVPTTPTIPFPPNPSPFVAATPTIPFPPNPSPFVAATPTVPTLSPTTANPTPQPTKATANQSTTPRPTLPAATYSSNSSSPGLIVGIVLAAVAIAGVFLFGYIRRMGTEQETITEEMIAADDDLALQDTPVVPTPEGTFADVDADLAPIEEGYADLGEAEVAEEQNEAEDDDGGVFL